VAVAYQVRAAGDKDLPGIIALLTPVEGDQERMRAAQFVVAEDDVAGVIGCGRLKPYRGFVELASIAIAPEWRGQGVGRAIVARLLAARRGRVYLMCEDNRLDFFGQFGFAVAPEAQLPAGLRPKWQHYLGQVGHLNLMRRE
jgi:N-acetylglutamate synthase-like GNAT family acetyltransferase